MPDRIQDALITTMGVALILAMIACVLTIPAFFLIASLKLLGLI